MIMANCYYMRFHFDFTKNTTIKGVKNLCIKNGIKAVLSDYDSDGYFHGLLCDVFNRQVYELYGQTNSDDIKIIDTVTVNVLLKILGIEFADIEVFMIEDLIIPNFSINNDTEVKVFRKGDF